MTTIADKQAREAFIARIQNLNENSTPIWGKMSVYQMLRHCSMWEEMALGRQVYKQSFMGKLFGKVALKSMMKNAPLKRSMPTVPSFIITDNGDVELEKEKLINLIEEHSQSPINFIHPFFGKMTAEQGLLLASKHLDHHLKQFGV